MQKAAGRLKYVSLQLEPEWNNKEVIALEMRNLNDSNVSHGIYENVEKRRVKRLKEYGVE